MGVISQAFYFGPMNSIFYTELSCGHPVVMTNTLHLLLHPADCLAGSWKLPYKRRQLVLRRYQLDPEIRAASSQQS